MTFVSEFSYGLHAHCVCVCVCMLVGNTWAWLGVREGVLLWCSYFCGVYVMFVCVHCKCTKNYSKFLHFTDQAVFLATS